MDQPTEPDREAAGRDAQVELSLLRVLQCVTIKGSSCHATDMDRIENAAGLRPRGMIQQKLILFATNQGRVAHPLVPGQEGRPTQGVSLMARPFDWFAMLIGCQHQAANGT